MSKSEKKPLAILGYAEGSAGIIDSWIEKYTDYYVSFFINPDDRPVDVIKGNRPSTQFSYPTKNSFKWEFGKFLKHRAVKIKYNTMKSN